VKANGQIWLYDVVMMYCLCFILMTINDETICMLLVSCIIVVKDSCLAYIYIYIFHIIKLFLQWRANHFTFGSHQNITQLLN
jgi:hypothetical protein